MGKADKPEKKNKKQKHFWKDFKAELKKVIWPTRSQVINNTIVVLVIVAIVTAICFVLDLAFEAMNTYGIDKLKSAVQNSISETVEDDGTSSDEDTSSEDETSDETSETENSETSEEEVSDEATIENEDNAETSDETVAE